MSAERPRTGLVLLASAIAIAIAVRTIAVVLPSRLDAALGAGVLVLAIAALSAADVVRLPPRVWQLAVPAVLLVAAMLWRDSEALFALDVLAFLVALGLMLPHAQRPRVTRAGASDYMRAAAVWGAYSVAGALPLAVQEIRWGELPVGSSAGRARRLGLGLAAALPCVVVFGTLFRSADPAYDRMLASLITVDLEPLAEHGAVVFVWSWIIAGYFWAVFRTRAPGALVRRHGSFGALEVTTALTVVLALFVSFVAFQATYLFGGEQAVHAMGLTYAEYARRGFFELVAVAVLVIPMLLVAEWAPEAVDARARTRIRWLAGSLVAIVFVLLASALDRMRLYTGTYGLTELRLYTTAFMFWLAVVLAWFVATVLRGRRTRFAWGAIVTGWLVLGALHIVNPDALIVATNARHPRPFDAGYASELSADAVPALLAVLGELPPDRACLLEAEALDPLVEAVRTESRWTVGLVQARRALEQRRVTEKSVCIPHVR